MHSHELLPNNLSSLASRLFFLICIGYLLVNESCSFKIHRAINKYHHMASQLSISINFSGSRISQLKLPSKLPLTSILLFKSGGANVELCRRDQRMDGQQPTQTQPFKDGADLAWILSGGWSTARLVNSTLREFPSSRLRTSVTSAL